MNNSAIIIACLFFLTMCNFVTVSVLEEGPDFLKLASSRGFVDKTMLIKRFIQSKNEKILVTAPKGFGKSFNMNMIRVFTEMKFTGRGIGTYTSNAHEDSRGKFSEKPSRERSENYNLFKNNSLSIYVLHRKFFSRYCGTYPTIYINLKNVNIYDYSEFLGDMAAIITSWFKKYDFLTKSDYVPKYTRRKMAKYLLKMEDQSKNIKFNTKRAFRFLFKAIHEHYSRYILLLIDEIDTPIIKAVNQKGLNFYKIWRFLQKFLWNTVGSTFVRKALINSRATVFSLFPEKRRSYFEHVPFLRDKVFSQFYGFTDADVDDLSNRFEVKNSSLKDIKLFYGGYTVLKTGTKLYNAWSVSKYFERLERLKSDRWTDEKQIVNLKKIVLQNEMVQRLETLLEGQPLQVFLRKDFMDSSYNELAMLQEIITNFNYTMEAYEADLVIQYLLHFGYFGIIGFDKVNKCLNVTIPNPEIGEYFAEVIYNKEYFISKFKFKPGNIDAYIKKILALRITNRDTFDGLANSVKTLFKEAKSPRHIMDAYRSLLTFASESQKFKTVNGELYRRIKDETCNSFHISRNDGIELLIMVDYGNVSTNCREEALNHYSGPTNVGREPWIVNLQLDREWNCLIGK